MSMQKRVDTNIHTNKYIALFFFLKNLCLKSYPASCIFPRVFDAATPAVNVQCIHASWSNFCRPMQNLFHLFAVRAEMWASGCEKGPICCFVTRFSNSKTGGLGPLFNCFGHVHRRGATPINPLTGGVSCPTPAPPGRAVPQGERWVG